jgi:UDP-N-acetylglucosamine diphosphorylase/glucosamine-1-phosphate N-acetyltransferase
MRVCVFEDRGVDLLGPLTLTRPAFALRCGASTLLAKHQRTFAAAEVGALVRPELAELCRVLHPQLTVNDPAWLRAGPVVLVNARWLPPGEPIAVPPEAHAALAGGQLAYAVVPAEQLRDSTPETLADCLERWLQELPALPAGGHMIDYPWDLVEHNAEALGHDFHHRWRVEGRSYRPAHLTVVGPSHALQIAPSAQVEPFVVADTTNGPVIIDREAVVHSFSRLEGPCYVGPHSHILGAKLRRGTSVGPCCRVGGEVEASILHGHVNKYHDGFLGHSYVGEWVNVAAGVQVSDLRNDYGRVHVTLAGRRIDTGRSKVGAFVGDHTKFGLSALVNTGSVIGAFCNVLPAGGLLPRIVPSFCRVSNGQLDEQPDLAALLATAAAVMQRRGQELTAAHAAFFRRLHERTSAERRQALAAAESRRYRRSA